MDFNKMTTDELTTLVTNISKELNRRDQQKREELWHNVIVAMRDYAEAFGDIIISTCGRGDYLMDVENTYTGVLQIKQ